MSVQLTEIKVRNYRALGDVRLHVGPVNVFFGPNGAGKSSLLDTLLFVHDCATRDVAFAAASRSQGVGLLWQGAEADEKVLVALTTAAVEYQIDVGLAAGQIGIYPGEWLKRVGEPFLLIHRRVGSDSALFYHKGLGHNVEVQLREPAKLSLTRYLDFESGFEDVPRVEALLRRIRLYSSRSFDLHGLRSRGAESSHDLRLATRADNLWSVLRNLSGRQAVDDAYATITGFMAEAFPSFSGLVLEATGPGSVYASFVEKRLPRPVPASGVADGHVQMLALLTALFSEGRSEGTILLLDEPETSMHPWALAVFAKAVKLAARNWGRQTFIATHSPVLLSQFDPDQVFEAEAGDGQAFFRRLSEIREVQDLLERYAVGSLYMAQEVGAQSKPEPASTSPHGG